MAIIRLERELESQPSGEFRFADKYRGRVVSCINTADDRASTGDLTPDGGALSKVGTRNGSAYTGAGNGLKYTTISANEITNHVGLTIVYCGDWSIASTTYLAGVGENTAVGGVFGLRKVTSPDALSCFYRGRASENFFEQRALVIADRVGTIVGRINSLSSASLFVNGRDVTGSPPTSSAVSSPNNYTRVATMGWMRNTGLYANTGTKAALVAILRDISKTEALELSKNPWQIFEPDTLYIPQAAAGGTVYTVDITDGIYFFDGDDNRDTSKVILDSLVNSDTRYSDKAIVVLDPMLLADSQGKTLEKIILDALLLQDVATVEALGTALSVTIIDYLFLYDTAAKDIQKTIKESLLVGSAVVRLLELFNKEELLLGSNLFKGIDVNRYDPLYLTDALFKQWDINHSDPLLMDDTDKLFLLRELLIRDNILLNEFSLTQLYTLVTAVLVYAKISTVDLLGINVTVNKNFLGITHGLHTGANQ